MPRYIAVPMEPAAWGWCVLDTKTNYRDHGCMNEQSCIAEASKRNGKIVRNAIEQGRKAMDLMLDALEALDDAAGVASAAEPNSPGVQKAMVRFYRKRAEVLLSDYRHALQCGDGDKAQKVHDALLTLAEAAAGVPVAGKTVDGGM